MTSSPLSFLILADDSAAWKVAGLAQLDRLVLALNEFIEVYSPNAVADAVIFWKPDIASTSRWLPRHRRINRIRLTESLTSLPSDAQVLDTHLFVHRGGLLGFLETTSPIRLSDVAAADPSQTWASLREQFRAACRSSAAGRSHSGWKYIESTTDIERCEKQFLRESGKSQDGLVSKFLNRPISRSLTRLLLNYDIAPTGWTTIAFVLPVAAFFLLLRGDYIGIVAGAAIFQVYSIVDGCDGEIARAKYLESDRGGRIDDFLDMLGSLLFVIGLGLGLLRSRASFYALEGVVCAAVIAANEWSLRRVKSDDAPGSQELTDALYPRHRRLFAQFGESVAGVRFLWWLLQFTKRDAAILVFLVLALLDLPQWILHLWLAVSAATLFLSARSSRDQTKVAGSQT